MDPLTDVLALAAVRGSVAASLAAAEPWSLRLSPVPRAAFHAVTSGTAWLEVDGGPPLHLQPGDTVLLPRGTEHVISSDTDVKPQEFDHDAAEAALRSGADMTAGSGPTTTRILCASYRHDAPAGADPFALLPDILHVRGAAATPALAATVRLLGDEMATSAPGQRVVLDRAVDILLIHLLRAHVTEADAAHERPSWFRGLRDTATSAALAELHRDPGRAWTAEELARRVGVSKATLARRFASEVGQTPAGYLTTWRMTVAAQTLRSGSAPVATVARSVGYTSEFAFNRAFTRVHGIAPGRYRNRERSAYSAA